MTATENKTGIVESLFPGTTIKSIHIPSEPEKELGMSQVKWQVTIEYKGKQIKSDYSTGIGHLQGYKHTWGQKLNYADRMAIRGALMTGRGDCENVHMKVKKPTLDDVMYCLVSDSDALQYDTFEEWAGDTGYDSDSRKAEEIYNACRKIGSELKKAFGVDGLTKLQEGFQGY